MQICLGRRILGDDADRPLQRARAFLLYRRVVMRAAHRALGPNAPRLAGVATSCGVTYL
jgi:hypothetical protein